MTSNEKTPSAGGDEPMPIVHAVWMGKSLGAMQGACLRSYTRHGHRVALHVYDEPVDVPAGIELADANDTMPRSEFVADRRWASYTLGSDIFRYRLLAAGAEIYVDCDMYCLVPLQRKPYRLGYENGGRIANALMSIPKNSPLVADLIDVVDNPQRFPPWYSFTKRLRFGLARTLGVHEGGFRDLPYASLGPPLLTYLIKKHHLTSEVEERGTYFHVPEMLHPESTMRGLVPTTAKTLHLGAASWKSLRHEDVPPNCAMAEVLRS